MRRDPSVTHATMLEGLLTDPDLNDEQANQARRAVLAATRGYGEDRDLFERFPVEVNWGRRCGRLSGSALLGLNACERAGFRRISVRRAAAISRGRPTDVV
jgi:hypothetical protein